MGGLKIANILSVGLMIAYILLVGLKIANQISGLQKAKLWLGWSKIANI